MDPNPSNPVGPKLLPMCPEWTLAILEAPPGFEPGMEVLQTSALPLGDGAPLTGRYAVETGPAEAGHYDETSVPEREPTTAFDEASRNHVKVGAGNGIRTRDFDLGKVALYH
jgi:hypothetical protein